MLSWSWLQLRSPSWISRSHTGLETVGPWVQKPWADTHCSANAVWQPIIFVDADVSTTPSAQITGTGTHNWGCKLWPCLSIPGSPYLLLNDAIEVYVYSFLLPTIRLRKNPPVQLLVPQLLNDSDVDWHLGKLGIKHLEPHDTACKYNTTRRQWRGWLDSSLWMSEKVKG